MTGFVFYASAREGANSNMFERFTDRARRVVVLAQAEARRLQHNYIGTEHLLLGLIAEGEGMASKALADLGVSLPELRAKVEKRAGAATQVRDRALKIASDLADVGTSADEVVAEAKVFEAYLTGGAQ